MPRPMKRPPPEPTLLDIARARTKFGDSPYVAISMLHSEARRALKLLPDTDERDAEIFRMVGELTDLTGTKASEGLIVVRHPASESNANHGRGNAPEPTYTPFTNDRPRP